MRSHLLSRVALVVACSFGLFGAISLAVKLVVSAVWAHTLPTGATIAAHVYDGAALWGLLAGFNGVMVLLFELVSRMKRYDRPEE